MFKKYLLKCSIMNYHEMCWEDEELYFDTKDEMMDFIKNGTVYVKPEDIRIASAFKLNKIDIEL